METDRLCIFLVLSREIQRGAKHNEEKKLKVSSKSLSLKRLTDDLEIGEEYQHLPSKFCYPEERLGENSDETPGCRSKPQD